MKSIAVFDSIRRASPITSGKPFDDACPSVDRIARLRYRSGRMPHTRLSYRHLLGPGESTLKTVYPEGKLTPGRLDDRLLLEFTVLLSLRVS
jgi:hypothetical protein